MHSEMQRAGKEIDAAYLKAGTKMRLKSYTTYT
jgi:hypothetical protein